MVFRWLKEWLSGCAVPVSEISTKLSMNPKGFSEELLRCLGEAADDHVWDNRDEVMASRECICTACYFRFPPSAVLRWQDDGRSAICPNPDCGFGGSVLGDASGLNLDDYDYSMFADRRN